MFLRREVERRHVAHLAHQFVGILVGADRHVGSRNVGDAGQFQRQRRLALPILFLKALHVRLQVGSGLHQALCLCLVSTALGLADGLGRRVALRLLALHLVLDGQPCLVHFHKCVGTGGMSARCHGLVEGIPVLPDPANIVHGINSRLSLK